MIAENKSMKNAPTVAVLLVGDRARIPRFSRTTCREEAAPFSLRLLAKKHRRSCESTTMI